MATHALGPGQVWLGGTRKPQCNQVNACSPLLTFDWTDGSATGTEGFAFPPQEPNMMVSPIYGRQDCISVLTSPADGQPASYGYPHGVTDDKFCTQTLHMYACGKAAR
uniref:C-type lectin domain-containing protein n=1 Tax=Caenorhabditis tropicalis TaxID=1561998 RepID=A0A1I7U1F0_9PELO